MIMKYIKELESNKIRLEDALTNSFYNEYKETEKYNNYITDLKARNAELERLIIEGKEKTEGLNRYVIFDVNAGLLADDDIVYAKNSKQAIEKVMKNKGIKGKIKRSGARNTRFKATKTVIKDNTVYRTGNDVWYEFMAI